MSTDVVARLTAAESDLLTQCETVIERGMGVFVEVGEALMSVRDNRLYRAEFATFEDYCRERWSLSTTHAYNLIDAAKVTELISSAIGGEDQLIPATERQTRELAPLLDQPEELREVWAEANTRTNGKPTAAAIREVREERAQQWERPPAWDPEERRRHEEEVRRRQDIEAARRAALTVVTEVTSLVSTIVAGSRLGETGLVTAQMVTDLRRVIDLLEKEVTGEAN